MIRGHIRSSFETPYLFNTIKYLSLNNDLEIYIHTWDIFQSKISWRNLEEKNTKVTAEIINNYFKELSPLIKKIIIENDKHIVLHGYREGFIVNAPLIGWKNMWYGQYKLIEYIKQNVIKQNVIKQNVPLVKHNVIKQNVNKQNDPLVINMRFDLFDNSIVFDFMTVLKFINNVIYYKNLTNQTLSKNIFIKNHPRCFGIDNIYIGNINTMHTLISHFHYNLDHIINIYFFNKKIKCHEVLVFLENKRLFSTKQLFIPKIKRVYHPSMYENNPNSVTIVMPKLSSKIVTSGNKHLGDIF
jgi:hypothetical protein